MLTVETEAVLVYRAQKGDRGAFGELVQRHQSGVVDVVYHMCSDAQLAQDAAQEAFIQAWLHLPSYPPQSSLRNWLYRIAVNAALDVIRASKIPGARRDRSLDLLDPQDNPEGLLVQKEQADQVQRAVQSLPGSAGAAGIRAVVLPGHRFYPGYPNRDGNVAAQLCPGTFETLASPARRFIRRSIMDEHVNQWLGAYLDGELNVEKQNKVKVHLASCRSCQVELEELKSPSNLLKAAARENSLTPDAHFGARVRLTLQPGLAGG